MHLSVVIPTYRRPDKIAACLRTLARQTLAPELYEVLVGLDGPDPDTAAACERAWREAGGRDDSLKVVTCDRVGLAAVRNRLIELARGEILLSLNDDVLADPDLCAVHAREGRDLLRAGRPATIVGDSPWLVHPGDTLFDCLVRETSMIFFYDQMTGPRRDDPWHDWGFRHAFGLNVSYPTALVREVGSYAVFPEKYGYEDTEIAWRLKRRFGMPVLFRPAAVATHDHRYTPDGYIERELKLGHAAVGFARTAPDCARDLFGRDILSGEERAYAEAFVQRERAQAQRLLATFRALANTPAAAVDGSSHALLVRALYEQHLPLKRYAFRRGYLAALRGEPIDRLTLFDDPAETTVMHTPSSSRNMSTRAAGFEDCAWLFSCDNRNRGILRQNVDEAAILWKACQQTAGPILEIGRRHAGSTCLLAMASGDRRIVSVDIDPQHHPDAEAFLSRPGVRERLDLRIGDSRVPIEGAHFGLIFIDGDHSYEGVLADTLAHWPSLQSFDGKPPLAVYHDAVPNPGLRHAGADNHCEGVLRLCQQLIEAGVARSIGSAGSMLVLEKLAELPAGFGLASPVANGAAAHLTPAPAASRPSIGTTPTSPATGDLAAVLAQIERIAELTRRGELFALDALPALTRLQNELDAAKAERDAARSRLAWLRSRLIDQTAQRCADAGYRRIALYGAGFHTTPIIRQPWQWRGVEVVAVLDDNPRRTNIGGVPVLRPAELREPIDAVVISSDSHEARIAAAARAHFGPRNIPVLRIYGDEPLEADADAVFQRLTTECGISVSDARWLIENRGERHDATLPMLPPQRTELHLRRYDFAAGLAAGKRVLDAASGAGYGAAMLARAGAASVTGIEIDPATVDYATRRFGRPGRVDFRVGDVTKIDLPSRSFDLITSFETIEHLPDPDLMLAEFARLLAPGGTLVISTPNDIGPTPYHHHSFTRESFQKLLMRHFMKLEWIGQVAGDDVRSGDLPAGLYPMGDGWPRPEFFIVVATVPQACSISIPHAEPKPATVA